MRIWKMLVHTNNKGSKMLNTVVVLDEQNEGRAEQGLRGQ